MVLAAGHWPCDLPWRPESRQISLVYDRWFLLAPAKAIPAGTWAGTGDWGALDWWRAAAHEGRNLRARESCGAVIRDVSELNPSGARDDKILQPSGLSSKQMRDTGTTPESPRAWWRCLGSQAESKQTQERSRDDFWRMWCGWELIGFDNGQILHHLQQMRTFVFQQLFAQWARC